MLRWLLFKMMLISALHAGAQQNLRFYTAADGLPSNQLYNILADSKGFIWVAHSHGLTRFDGNRFTNYSNPDQNSEGVTDLVEDKNGVLWCHNFGGQIFRIVNNNLQLFEKYKWREQKAFPGIMISEKNELIATHTKGIYIYNIENGHDTIITPNGESHPFLHVALAKVQNKTFCLFKNGLYRVESDHFNRIEPIQKDSFNFQAFPTVLGDFRDSLFLLSVNRQIISVIQITGDKYSFARKFPAPEGVFFISKTSEDDAWLCGKNGSYALRNPNRKIENLSITGFARDNEGNRWFSTLQNGLVLINRFSENIKPFGLKLSNTEIIKAVSLWNGKLAVATNKGKLYLLAPNGETLSETYSPNKNNIDALHVTADSILLAGTDHLLKYHPASNSLIFLANTSSVKDISTDSAGNIFVANAYNIEKISAAGEMEIFRSKRCWTAEYSHYYNTVYSSFADGLYAFKNQKQKELTAYGKSIFANTIAVQNEYLVVGTINNGVFLFVNDSAVKHLYSGNDLLSDHVLKVKFFNGKAWILTEKSIAAWDLETGKIIHYPFGDNFMVTNVSDFIYWNNRLILANGNRLDVMSIYGNTGFRLPNAFIDRVVINSKDTIFNPGVNLKFNQNDISFHIGGISYSSGKHIQFQYQLIGTDTAWRTVNASQYIINFPLLQPGNYNFRVRAVAFNGDKGSIKAYQFKILQPWWKKTWFMVTTASIIALFIYLYLTSRIRSINQKNELLLEKLNLQSQWRDSMLAAIRSQMNPHFIFNALNTIQSYIYTNDEVKASNYLGKFSDLIRKILDYSQKKQISLADEIDLLQLYVDLEVIRFENTMVASIMVDPELSLDTIYLPPMLVQPYVENAIKHGLLHKTENRELNIRVLLRENENLLLIEIEDNGIGRKQSEAINRYRKKNHNSFSTLANKQRLEILNFSPENRISIETIDKTDDHQQPAGTLVQIKIPLQTGKPFLQNQPPSK